MCPSFGVVESYIAVSSRREIAADCLDRIFGGRHCRDAAPANSDGDGKPGPVWSSRAISVLVASLTKRFDCTIPRYCKEATRPLGRTRSDMKETLLDANFPRDSSNATYHVGTKPGQVANRIITVGDHVRARRIAAHFEPGSFFELQSQRNFLTLTGTYKGVPITCVSIGMGLSAVDFFVRECRAIVEGEMIIVRMGSCGSIDEEVPIGSVVVPMKSYGLTRNYDYFHPETTADERASGSIEPYSITKPLDCHSEIHDALFSALDQSRPKAGATGLFGGKAPQVKGNVVNGSADR